MKNNKVIKIIFIIFMIVMIIMNIFLVLNTLTISSSNRLLGSVSHSDYLDSSNVTYLDSNVQDSIDNLYTKANDYSSINTRVNTVEKYINHGSDNLADWLSVGRTTYTGQKGILIHDTGIIRGSLYYDPNYDKTSVASYNSSGQIGKGILNLNGNPVQINGTDVNDLKTRVTGVSLFTGSGNSDVSLSDSVSNYKYILISYRCMAHTSNNYGIETTLVPTEYVGQNIDLKAVSYNSSKYYMCLATYKMNSSSLNLVGNTRIPDFYELNQLYIYKVEGIR